MKKSTFAIGALGIGAALGSAYLYKKNKNAVSAFKDEIHEDGCDCGCSGECREGNGSVPCDTTVVWFEVESPEPCSTDRPSIADYLNSEEFREQVRGVSSQSDTPSVGTPTKPPKPETMSENPKCGSQHDDCSQESEPEKIVKAIKECFKESAEEPENNADDFYFNRSDYILFVANGQNDNGKCKEDDKDKPKSKKKKKDKKSKKSKKKSKKND